MRDCQSGGRVRIVEVALHCEREAAETLAVHEVVECRVLHIGRCAGDVRDVGLRRRIGQCERGDGYAVQFGILEQQLLVVAALAEHEHVGIAYDLPLAPQVVLETGVLDGADVIGEMLRNAATSKWKS